MTTPGDYFSPRHITTPGDYFSTMSTADLEERLSEAARELGCTTNPLARKLLARRVACLSAEMERRMA